MVRSLTYVAFTLSSKWCVVCGFFCLFVCFSICWRSDPGMHWWPFSLKQLEQSWQTEARQAKEMASKDSEHAVQTGGPWVDSANKDAKAMLRLRLWVTKLEQRSSQQHGGSGERDRDRENACLGSHQFGFKPWNLIYFPKSLPRIILEHRPRDAEEQWALPCVEPS